ncbi:hypothetical protein FRB99_003667 [Tulasnella sp. 403]|nr:hypothetical protein FRB99_003667 [Tulasnella sp. 403]
MPTINWLNLSGYNPLVSQTAGLPGISLVTPPAPATTLAIAPAPAPAPTSAMIPVAIPPPPFAVANAILMDISCTNSKDPEEQKSNLTSL